MFRSLVAAAAVLALSACAPLQRDAVVVPYEAPSTTAQAFVQAPLPYGFDALEPVIDQATMQVHYSRHHKAYHEALNRAAAADPALARMSLEQILAEVSRHGAQVRNNAGGAWNHAFFWRSMAPAGQRGTPSPQLLQRIRTDFGSLENMQKAFDQAGATRFGSGWVWLVAREGRLAISTTPNQDNPLMDVAELRGVPLLGNDVWEHAYYLKYQNRRADYLQAWWQVVNWNEVNRRFDALR